MEMACSIWLCPMVHPWDSTGSCPLATPCGDFALDRRHRRLGLVKRVLAMICDAHRRFALQCPVAVVSQAHVVQHTLSAPDHLTRDSTGAALTCDSVWLLVT